MTGAHAQMLPDAQRLHLQHGPSDLIVWAVQSRQRAYPAATKRFETIISEIVEELDDLRQRLSPLSPAPLGEVAMRMHEACFPFAQDHALTRMAAVAGGVADEVLSALVAHSDPKRAYVNNGGDIALYLAPQRSFKTSMRTLEGAELGVIEIRAEDGIGGIATSGRQGRSLSRGIADSVTVLAKTAAEADVAATLIANAVDLPNHPSIIRKAARDVQEHSDLGELPVVVACGPLTEAESARALEVGLECAKNFQLKGLITSAALFLKGQSATTGAKYMKVNRELCHV